MRENTMGRRENANTISVGSRVSWVGERGQEYRITTGETYIIMQFSNAAMYQNYIHQEIYRINTSNVP